MSARGSLTEDSPYKAFPNPPPTDPSRPVRDTTSNCVLSPNNRCYGKRGYSGGRTMKLRQAVAGACALALGLGGSQAWGWGAEGHAVIAQVAVALAEKQDPGITGKITAIYANNILHRQWTANGKVQTCDARSLDELASWADCMRYSPKTLLAYTGPYHFDNVPLSAPLTATTPNTWCAQGCATAKIPYYEARLKDATLSASDRAEALAFVIHLVGDLHQPLHTENNADGGGNSITFPTLYPGETGPMPLHSYWDTWLVTLALGKEPAAIATVTPLTAKLGPQPGTPTAQDLRGWLIGTHGQAVQAYHTLNLDKTTGAQSMPAAPPPAYVQKFTPVVRSQIALASARLAAILEASVS
jgi:hypothetical protein